MKKKEKMTKEKKNKWIWLLLLIIFLLIFIILFLLFGREKSFTIVFDTNGGTEITNIEVKDGEIVKLPEPPKKEGHKFVGWTNKKGNIVTNGTKVTNDITLKAEWIPINADTITISFNSDNGDDVNNIIIEKGKIILLPINPTKEGYKFVGWLNEDGNLITENMNVTTNISLKALWIKEDVEIININFNTDGGSDIKSVILENGKSIILPVNPTKEGFVFAGWVDENGNQVNKDTILSKNITLKALWKEPYTCPTGCTPIGDGSKCSKEVTQNMINKTTCPSGYTLKNGQCLDIKNKYHANSIDVSPWWACNSSNEVMYSEIDQSGMGAFMWCAKKTSKITIKGCPSGYTQSGNICKKTETIKCTAN